MRAFADKFIKPNALLTSFERLEIYNRQYWYRLLEGLREDYPGLRAVIGERRFAKLAEAYLVEFPSASFSLRNLGSRLEQFLRANPSLTSPRAEIALDMARFEWAQVVAFDGEAKPTLTPDDLLDCDPAELRLGLQPYLSILELSYPVDDFCLTVKKEERALRSDASNALQAAQHRARRKRWTLPAAEKVYVAVHRQQNLLYFKRLTAAGYALLDAVQRGATLQDACTVAAEHWEIGELDWPAQIKAWFGTWSSLGWFWRPKPEGIKF